MPNYYHNKMTGELISYDPETGKVCEFEQVQLYEATLSRKDLSVKLKVSGMKEVKESGGG